MAIEVQCSSCGKQWVVETVPPDRMSECPDCATTVPIPEDPKIDGDERVDCSEPAQHPSVACVEEESPQVWSRRAKAFGSKLASLTVDAARFYWVHRHDFVKTFVEIIPPIREMQERGDEVRFRADRDYFNAGQGPGGWKIRFPDGCAVCGEKTTNAWIKQSQSVPNLLWPILALNGALVAGVITALFLWNRWPIPIGLLAGYYFGYLARREGTVRLRFRYCDVHAETKHIPKLWLIGDNVLVRVGKKIFADRMRRQGKDTDYDTDMEPSVSSRTEPSAVAPQATRDDEPLPLANDVRGSVQQEKSTPLAGGNMENHDTSSDEDTARAKRTNETDSDTTEIGI